VVVLNSLPSLGLNVLLDGIRAVINAQTNNSDIVTPLLFVLSKHLLVMSHRLLAWRTPSGPQIIQNDLAFLVLNIGSTFLEHKVCFSNRGDHVTNANLSRETNSLVSLIDQLEYFIDLFRDLLGKLGLVSLECSLGLQAKLSSESLAGNISDKLINQFWRIELVLNTVLLKNFIYSEQKVLSLFCREINEFFSFNHCVFLDL